MDLFFVILFLAIYYIRPQDWMPGLIGVNLVKPIVAFGMLSLLSKKRGLSPGDFFQTPHDWAILFYSAYIVFTAPDITSTFTALAPLPVFYWLTTLALDSEERILYYTKWWLAMLLVLAALGVASLYGFDPTGAVEYTEIFEGRLSLGTWTHNNPNAFGHSVVVAIPLVYFLMFWKSPMKNRILAIPLFALTAYAAWETRSKGAFLVGGGAIVLAVIFGRSKFFQILILTAALAGGGTLMMMMPRMSQMNNLRADEGVMGRILAWEMARTASKANDYGVGWKQFQAYVEYQGGLYAKATHSSYVRIAADLGYPGLFFFVAILWCNLRVLMTSKTDHLDLERARRVLFLLLATYVMSGWMIDRSYHTEYFLLAACCASIHRLQLKQKRRVAEEEALVMEEEVLVLDNDFHTGVAGALESGSSPAAGKLPDTPRQPPMESGIKSKLQAWTKLGLLDLGVAIFLTWATLYTWDYLLENI